MAVAAIPGRAMGSTTLRKACIVDAPSMNAASSMLRGSAMNTLYMIHMARGMKPEVVDEDDPGVGVHQPEIGHDAVEGDEGRVNREHQGGDDAVKKHALQTEVEPGEGVGAQDGHDQGEDGGPRRLHRYVDERPGDALRRRPGSPGRRRKAPGKR